MYYIGAIVMAFNTFGFMLYGFKNADAGSFAMGIICMVLTFICLAGIYIQKQNY